MILKPNKHKKAIEFENSVRKPKRFSVFFNFLIYLNEVHLYKIKRNINKLFINYYHVHKELKENFEYFYLEKLIFKIIKLLFLIYH